MAISMVGAQPISAPYAVLIVIYRTICFQCPTVMGEIRIGEKYENVFGDKIYLELAKTLELVTKLREK